MTGRNNGGLAVAERLDGSVDRVAAFDHLLPGQARSAARSRVPFASTKRAPASSAGFIRR
jgi:hypothetical protein